MTADDSRAVPDTEAVREALAWFRTNRVVLDGPEFRRMWHQHAATIVRAALERDVSGEPMPYAWGSGDGDGTFPVVPAAGPRAGDTTPDPQPVNADLRDRIRNYPGDGPHRAGAGDTAPDDALAAIGADVLRDHAGRLASVAEFDEVLAFRAGKGITHSFHSSAVRDLLIECHTIRSEYDRLRSDAAALRDAVQVAAARHTADARLGYDDVRCASCSDEAWPCPTATALDAWRSAAGGES